MTDPVSDAAEQLVEHVDADGNVIEIITRAEMRAGSLRHRCVYIVVVSPDDEVLVHKRADWKDVFPGAWDLAFGGVCDPGESWSDSAIRELHEEAGLVSPLTDLGAVAFEAADVRLVGRLYRTESTGPFVFNDGEVTATRWIPRHELQSFVDANTCPDDTVAVVLPAILSWD